MTAGPMTLGDTVFRDANNNGTLDTGETGVAGVVVELLDQAGTTVLGDDDDQRDRRLHVRRPGRRYVPGPPRGQQLQRQRRAGRLHRQHHGRVDPDDNVNNDNNGSRAAPSAAAASS